MSDAPWDAGDAMPAAGGTQRSPVLPPVLHALLAASPGAMPQQAWQLNVVDAEGFPHTVLLSAGEVWPKTPDCLHFALWAASRTVRYLAQRPAATFAVVAGERLHQVRLEMRRVPLTASAPGVVLPELAWYVGRVLGVESQHAGYARLVSGLTFELPPVLGGASVQEREPAMEDGLKPSRHAGHAADTLRRWEAQRALLRALV